MRNNLIIAALLFSFVLSSCVGDNLSNNNNITSNETLDAWMKANKPDFDQYEKYEDGFYLKITPNPNPGSNTTSPVDTSVVGINYNVMTLNGDYVANTNAQTARILGRFSNKTNYVPFTFVLKNFQLYNGLAPAMYLALKKMRIGDKAEIYAAPEWGYSNTALDSIYLGLTGNVSLPGNQLVHINLSLDSIENKPAVSERTLLYNYAQKNFSNKYTIVRTGIYKDIKVNRPNLSDTIPSDTTLSIDYIGYLPNGFVFDTSLEEIAKERRIYNSESEYTPLSYKYNRKDTTNFDGKIPAWRYVINTMKVGEQAVFISDSKYCYGNGGQYSQNATLLPVFTPLVFYIHILTPEEAELREE